MAILMLVAAVRTMLVTNVNSLLKISVFHRAFFNSIIDKHQHMHFFTFKTVLV